MEEIDWTWNWYKFLFIIFACGIVAVITFDCVRGYPVIISSPPINHTQAKEMVYSIPEKYYTYVDVIEFHEKYLVKDNSYYAGWTWALWDEYHYCYSARIDLYGSLDIHYLWHELGHNHEQCVLMLDYEYDKSEAFAERFETDRGLDYEKRYN